MGRFINEMQGTVTKQLRNFSSTLYSHPFQRVFPWQQVFFVPVNNPVWEHCLIFAFRFLFLASCQLFSVFGQSSCSSEFCIVVVPFASIVPLCILLTSFYIVLCCVLYFVLPVDPASSYLTLSLSPLGVLSPTLSQRKKHVQFARQKLTFCPQDTQTRRKKMLDFFIWEMWVGESCWGIEGVAVAR